MDRTDLIAARQTYDTLLNAIAANGWACRRDDGKLTVKYTVIGNGLNAEYYVLVDAENRLLWIYTELPFAFDGDMTEVGAVAVSMVNFYLDNGNFDIDVNCGKVKFRMATSYRDSVISEEAIIFELLHSAATVDEFGKRLRELAQGDITIDNFLK